MPLFKIRGSGYWQKKDKIEEEYRTLNSNYEDLFNKMYTLLEKHDIKKEEESQKPGNGFLM